MKRMKILIPTVLAGSMVPLFSIVGCNQNKVYVESISLDQESLTVQVGRPTTLHATILPENASDKTIEWTSSNPDVIVENGVIKATKVVDDDVIITAKAKGTNPEATDPVVAICTVKTEAVYVESIELNKTQTQIEESKTEQLEVSFSPADATDKTVTWSSSNSDVATVENGLVKVKKYTNDPVTITAKAEGAEPGETVKATCEVTVPFVKVKTIKFNEKVDEKYEVGATFTLTCKIEPENATDKTVTWASSDNNVATVEDGLVTCKAAGGPVTITATANNGQDGESVSDSCTFEVLGHVEGVDIDDIGSEAYYEMGDGGEDGIYWTCTVTPTLSIDPSVTWTTSDSTVLEIKQQGETQQGKSYCKLVPKKLGTSTITVTTNDGAKTDSVNVTIEDPFCLEQDDKTANVNPTVYYTRGVSAYWAYENYRYRFDDEIEWTEWKTTGSSPWTSTPLELKPGRKLFVKNVGGYTGTINYHYQFHANDEYIKASGDIRSLLGYEQGFSDYCFCYMFEGCTYLTEAPELPFTSLAAHCYDSMFKGCTSLVKAPQLPATTLQGYCYANMFEGCTALENPPEEIMSDDLPGFACLSMFDGCTSLTATPKLVVTSAGMNCCWSMFENCEKLNNLDITLSAVAQTSYTHMFSGCKALTSTPIMPPIDVEPAQQCYAYMFKDCTSLKVKEVDDNTNEDHFIIHIGNQGDMGRYAEQMFTNTGGDFQDGTPHANKSYYWYD